MDSARYRANDGAHAAAGRSGTPAGPAYHRVPRPVPLYGAEFAADPRAVYARLRRYGQVAPVEIAPGVGAHLVVGYRAALDLLHDTETWSKDPRAWQATVPPDCPVLPLLGWRPNPMYNDGEAHRRYRRVVTDTLGMIGPHALRARTRSAADALIRRFAAAGTADLVADYARDLPLMLFNQLFGVPEEDHDRLVAPLAALLEASGPRAAGRAGDAVTRYVGELVNRKVREPGDDLTSWFLAHPARLTTEEVVHHVALALGAGIEPVTNLISNALSRMLGDDRYYSTLAGGALTAWDAVHDVLREEPPIANLGAHFPRRAVEFHGVRITPGELVLISYGAANTTPDGLPPGPRSDGGAHLAWSAGPHACPARGPALLIATTAIEQLTGQLCDLALAVPRDRLAWRPGPFHTALAHLPVRFTPVRDTPASASAPRGGLRPAPPHRL
ncbi:cytochrome P450 [Streptomyces pactum]|uniref:Cytochrome P450 n=1 Tax=Streptomyces pactum TaxID=68249 RepID=A0ABS0NPI1_9ACTN|nr:cytochrome P450 [Streptomyces pactum]MBH5337107.1 cytochrome P450 [Streptomyces pactum]